MKDAQSVAILLETMISEAGTSASRRKLEQIENSIIAVGKAYEIGIITALPLESVAVQAAFGDSKRIPSGCRDVVDFFEIESNAGQSHERKPILLAQCLEMGNNSAAVAATAMLSSYPSISNIVLVGIAGGVPHIPEANASRRSVDDHVRKGDIVVSDQVLQYDMIKLEIGGYENRSRARPPSAQLIRAVNYMEQKIAKGEYPWEAEIDRMMNSLKWSRPNSDILRDFIISDRGVEQLRDKVSHPAQSNRRKQRPLVHRGNIGSANILLKNPAVREQLRAMHKIRAVEMEGSGVADAAWAFNVGYLVVRGVCDYCDMEKDNKWQKYAALVAAGYAKVIIDQVLFG